MDYVLSVGRDCYERNSHAYPALPSSWELLVEWVGSNDCDLFIEDSVAFNCIEFDSENDEIDFTISDNVDFATRSLAYHGDISQEKYCLIMLSKEMNERELWFQEDSCEMSTYDDLDDPDDQEMLVASPEAMDFLLPLVSEMEECRVTAAGASVMVAAAAELSCTGGKNENMRT